MKRIFSKLFLPFLLLIACAETSTDPLDNEATADADTYDFWKDGPQRPYPVDWGTCSEGWEPKEEKDEEGNLLAKYCEPPTNWRPVAPVDWGDCPEGWEPMEEKDEDGNLLAKYCEPTLCPDGEFAVIPAETGTEIIYVYEGESIQAAIDGAQDGAVIAIGKGTFTEEISIMYSPSKAVTLWGACVEGTTIRSETPTTATMAAVISIRQANKEKLVTIKNLTVTGRRIGVFVGSFSQVRLEQMAIEESTEMGLFAESEGKPTVNIDSVLIRGTLPRESDGMLGRGVYIQGNVTATLSRVLVEKNKEAGVAVGAFEGTHATFSATDLIVRDTLPQKDNSGGEGIGIQVGNQDKVTVSFSRLLVERNIGAGIYASAPSPDSHIAIEKADDLIVRHTRPDARDQTMGRGIEIEDNVTAFFSRVLIEKNKEVGVFILTTNSESFSTVTAANLVVRDTEPQQVDQTAGRGIAVQGNVTATLSNTLVEKNTDVGFSVRVPLVATHAKITATNLIVRDTFPQNDGTNGRGIIIEDNVTATFSHMLVERNSDAGVFMASFVSGTSPEITANDFIVRDTLLQGSDQTGGTGIAIQKTGTATLVRGLVERNAGTGIYVSASSPESHITLKESTDLLVRHTGDATENAGDLTFGRGIAIQDNVTATLSRTLVEKNREVGFFVSTATAGTHASVNATDLIVRDTLPQNDKTAGRGLVIQSMVSATFFRLLAEKNRDVGFFVSASTVGTHASVNATDIIVRDTESQESDKTGGRGINIQFAVDATMTNIQVENNREMGLLVAGQEASAQLTHAEITDTRILECYGVENGCEEPFGHGLGVYEGSEVTLTDVVIDGNQNGLQMTNSKVFAGENCTLPLGDKEGKVACLHLLNNQTGLNAFGEPIEGYDRDEAFALERNGGTWYSGNETPFSSAEEAIPQPMESTIDSGTKE